MSWYDRVRQRARGYEIQRLYAQHPELKAELNNVPDWALHQAALGRYNLPPLDVVGNQASLLQKQSWVHSSVMITGQTAAVVPLNIKNYIDEEATDIINHPVEQLMRRPNDLDVQYSLMLATVASYRVTGNAYWWLNRTTANGSMSPAAPPVEIWPVPAHRIQPIPDGKMYIAHYEFDAGQGDPIEIPIWQIVHFKTFNPLNPFVGLSPIEAIALQIKGDLSAQEYNLSFYADDNAKADGILAFADPIPDPQWNKLKGEIKTEYGGGVRRSLMTLRGVGKGGVDFMNTVMSRKDMEFLAGRDFSRKEIYEVMAPGLASMLDTTSDVASARTGKASFVEMTVWPILKYISQIVTRDLLPAYGENLIAEFEDIRLSDQAMEHQEMDRAYQVITVNEARAKYWSLDPLEDERGDKLVAGVGITPPQLQPGNNDKSPQFLETGGEESDDEETSGQMKAMNGRAQPVEVPPTPRQQMRDELDTWQRWVVNRIKAGKTLATTRAFETEILPGALSAALAGALETVQTVEDAGLVFDDARRTLEFREYP